MAFLLGEQCISPGFSGTFSSENVDISASGLDLERGRLKSCGWGDPTWELGYLVSYMGHFCREWGPAQLSAQKRRSLRGAEPLRATHSP